MKEDRWLQELISTLDGKTTVTAAEAETIIANTSVALSVKKSSEIAEKYPMYLHQKKNRYAFVSNSCHN